MAGCGTAKNIVVPTTTGVTRRPEVCGKGSVQATSMSDMAAVVRPDCAAVMCRALFGVTPAMVRMRFAPTSTARRSAAHISGSVQAVSGAALAGRV